LWSAKGLYQVSSKETLRLDISRREDYYNVPLSCVVVHNTAVWLEGMYNSRAKTIKGSAGKTLLNAKRF